MKQDIDFTDLHVHSSFSLLDGAANPEAIVDATKKLGRKYLALTDHGNTDGAIRFQQACEKHGVLPIFGQEIYMAEHWNLINESKHKFDNLHLTVLAKDREGFSKLLAATGFAHNEGWSNKKRRPFLPMRYPLENGWAGHIVILTGCASSPFWNVGEGKQLLRDYADTFGQDFYAELMPNSDWAPQSGINARAINAAVDHGLKLVTTTDIHYITKEDAELHEVLIGLPGASRGITWNHPDRWTFGGHTNYVHTVADIYDAYKVMGLDEETVDGLILNTREIAEKCFHRIEKTPIQLPRILDCPDDQEFDRFLEIVGAGFDRRQLPHDSEYLTRLEYEVKVLRDKNFIRYMLMVWDVVRWSKDNGIFVGPARGSAGGSLVGYCMGITELDPVKYRLFFERFIDPNRNDYPDIDVDFEDRNRHLVEQYLRQKYGPYNVAHISTFGAMLGRGAIRDVSRLFEVPLAEVDRCSKAIIGKHETDERANKTIEDSIEQRPEVREFAEKYPKVVKYASKLEGNIRSCGVHASGILVSPVDLRSCGNTYLVKRSDKENDDRKMAVNWDMLDIEHMGFVKLDVLGLSTLSAVSEALKLIESRYGTKLELGKLTLDDKKTYEMIGRGETMTCFQIGTPGISRYCAKLKPDNFEHLAAITALWRPGPITSGAADAYADCKNGKRPVEYFNDAFKSVTEISYGQIIYQEQIAQILMKLAGYTYSAADKVRKIVSKKGGVKAWDDEEPKFIAGCNKVGLLDEQRAHKLWQESKMFALYAFNRAHSVGYGLLAYWTAFLKARYPAEWLCATLNYANGDKEDKNTGESAREVTIREARRTGIPILPPDLNRSGVMWTVEDRDGKPSLRVGLKDVQGVGPTAINAIEKVKLSLGAIRSLKHLAENVDRRAVHKGVIRPLLYVGALDEIIPESERHLWINLFDRLYEDFDSPKKWATIQDISYAALSPERIAQMRSDSLRFDPWVLSGKSMAEDILEVLGDGFDLDTRDGDEHIVRGDQSWPVCDVAAGIMPGAKGVIGPSANTGIRAHRAETKACTACTLRSTCTGPVPIDPGAINVMIVAEAPGRDEDAAGSPLIGESGQKLWAALAEHGIDRQFVHVTNTVKCKPPKRAGSVKPFPEEITGCPWLAKEMKLLRPKCVLALGNSALYFFRGQESGIMGWAGRTEWNHRHKCWVTYGLHPAITLYDPEKTPLFKTGIAEWARVLTQFS